jgi:uncharacterized protein YdhG (YjbR/CyaY superfamily)
MSPTQKPRTATSKASKVFSKEEQAAMKELVAERRRQSSGKADGESDVLAKIAEMPAHDRTIAERIHALIKATAPELLPRTWYGMPAYARGGDVVCFFQAAAKFKARYSTLGFSDKANLDDGDMWPSSYALKELTAGSEARIAELIKRAVKRP